jgi:hypothetical protein
VLAIQKWDEVLNTDLYAKLANPGAAPILFRVPIGQRLFSLFGVVFLAFATVVMGVFAILAFRMLWALGLFIMLLAAFMGALVDYVWRDLRGKWGLRIVLNADTVTLDLPSWRSLIHRPPAQHLTVPYTDIAGIDARFEAYGSLGMEMMQRAYAMHLKGGDLIFLFEERALGTAMASSTFAGIVANLARRAGVTIRELGTVEGKGGALGAWGTHAPDWAAPPLPRDRAMRLWGRAASTGGLTLSLLLIVTMLMRFFGTG